MENKETISLAEKHDNNPFLLELKGKMFLQPRANAIIAKGQNIIDTSTGEIINESVLIGRRKIVDKSQFAKLYASEIGILYDLSKTAQNIFLYLTKIMDYDNKAYFSYVKDLEKVGYKSKGTVYKGLRELVKNNIIAPSSMTNVYWLNPTIVCKGERFAKYTEYVVGKDGEQVKAESALKAQGKEVFDSLPEEIGNKINKANEKDLFSDLEQNSPYNK